MIGNEIAYGVRSNTQSLGVSFFLIQSPCANTHKSISPARCYANHQIFNVRIRSEYFIHLFEYCHNITNWSDSFILFISQPFALSLCLSARTNE